MNTEIIQIFNQLSNQKMSMAIIKLIANPRTKSGIYTLIAEFDKNTRYQQKNFYQWFQEIQPIDQLLNNHPDIQQIMVDDSNQKIQLTKRIYLEIESPDN